MIDKQIGICNKALLLIGAKRISSFDEQSTEAITCNDFYESSYQALLNMYPFSFAQTYKDLAIIANVTPGDPRFKYAFKLPTDLLWLLQVIPNQSEYKVVGDQLHMNAAEIKIKYTFRANEELMSAVFEQMFMYYLASQICITLTEDRTKQAELYVQYTDHAKKARALDAQQHPQDQFAEFPLDSARYGS